VRARYIEEGDPIPFGYGLAWYDPFTDTRCCLPLGINVLAHYGRRAYHWLKVMRDPSVLDVAYKNGRNDQRSYEYSKPARAAWDSLAADLRKCR
jgi:hypothetical protein